MVLYLSSSITFKCRPAQRWDTTDITYIATDEGWLYLVVVLNLYARKVMAGRCPNG
jgi:transposase InsO family protein